MVDRLTVLEAFVRLVELGSFSAVARELRVRQSTISKWIAALEEELGATLVERTSRRRHVTEPGQRFYERARELLAAYDDAVAEVSQATSGVLRGRLRISAPVVFGRLFLLPLLPAFLRQHPLVELQLSFDDRYVDLLEGGHDLALRVGRPVDSSLRARTVASSERLLVAAPSYLQRRGTPTRVEHLGEHDCLVHSGVDATTWRFNVDGAVVSATASGRLAADNSEALLALAKEGFGVALLARWLVAPALGRGELRPLLAGCRAPPAPVQLLMPPSGQVTAPARALVEHLAEALPPTLP